MKQVKQNIHGVVLLNKPTGISSNKALQKVKHLYKAKKAGHTGSLDPLATGLLPICFGQATKVTEYLLDADKKYTTVIRLGQVTDTLDSDGVVLETHPVHVLDTEMESVLAQFRGRIKQVPPMYSALKKNGQPLYKLARKGEEVERPARDMTVYELTAERIDEVHFRLNVHCSSGFYIRSLAHDIGQVLGCGAHVAALCRTESKGISLDQAVSLEQLEDSQFRSQALLPIDVLLQSMPRLPLSEQQCRSLLQGRPTDAAGLQSNELARFYWPQGRLFGVGRVSPTGQLKTDKIFVESG